MRPLTTLTICVAESERAAGLASRACDPERTIVIRNGVDAAGAVPTRGDGSDPTRRGRRPPAATQGSAHARARARPRSRRASRPSSSARVPTGRDSRRRSAGSAWSRRSCSPATSGDVADLLARADVFVLSSTSEGLPLSILEAMAAALPVVASSVGGVPEAVEDGETGLLVPPRDPVRLAAALERLLVDPALRRRLGANGRARVLERFGLEAFQAGARRRLPPRARSPWDGQRPRRSGGVDTSRASGKGVSWPPPSLARKSSRLSRASICRRRSAKRSVSG